MKLNRSTKITGQNIVLVPYESKHVMKYHKWMENEEIRRLVKLTGSERLSLQEEYEMQQSWRNDEDKLTFIILLKEELEVSKSEDASMIGDVNLFVNNEEKSAEAEIMIAEDNARGKGAGSEALKLMFSYALQQLEIQKFFVKITDDNEASLRLFEEKLGFERISHSSAFKEYTLELPYDKLDHFRDYLKPSQIDSYS